SVVAELLEFVAGAHADGLLLNGLGPSALLVDRAGRTHYLGTDTAVQMTGPAGGKAGFDWQRFFPPERYPRGYSAPECFDPAAPRCASARTRSSARPPPPPCAPGWRPPPRPRPPRSWPCASRAATPCASSTGCPSRTWRSWSAAAWAAPRKRPSRARRSTKGRP